jgi:hypothetical protein
MGSPTALIVTNQEIDALNAEIEVLKNKLDQTFLNLKAVPANRAAFLFSDY